MPKRARSIPIREVAERLGVTKQAVHGMLRRGRLEKSHAASIPGRYRNPNAFWIKLEGVERLEAQRAEHKGGDHA